MDDIILSILICTIPERAKQLQRLMDHLRPQIPFDGTVEVIIQEENRSSNGGPTIGANRNSLLEKAGGTYVCFVDDDDMVSEDYVERILEALMTGPHVVGIEGHYTQGENKPILFRHSMQYDKWFTDDKGVLCRCPNHLNPVLRELALKAGFPDQNHGEDHEYSKALLPLLKTEEMIDSVIYFYHKK